MRIASAIYQSFPLVNAPKIHTDLLWDLSLLFTGLGLVYFLFVFVLRNRLSGKSARIAQRKKELAPMISNFLFHEDDATIDEKQRYINLKIEARELLKHKFNRRVLTEVLLDLQRDVSGDARQRIFSLYTDLGLHLDAFKRLKSWHWETVSQAILELTQMQVEEAYTFIQKFINDRRSVIRKQAQLATVTLKDEGLEYFMDANKHRISEWQQLRLLDILRDREDFVPPRFRAWLTSKNRDTVLFALRLIKYYNQNDANASLIQLVKHKNSHIKSEAIICLREFGVFEAIETLKSVFWRCRSDVKLLLLDAIGELGTEKEIEFLKSIEKKEVNFNVRSKTLSAINAISPEYIIPTEGLMETLDSDPEPFDRPKEETPETTTNPTEMKPESKPVKPDPEKHEDTDFFDPEKEDIAIFEICFQEEFQDILAEASESEQESEAKEILPLDFLPIVEGEAQEEINDPLVEVQDENLYDIEVEAELVSEEESFRRELEGILARIEVPVEEEEPFTLSFLPLVMEEDEEEENKVWEENEIREIPISYEEVMDNSLAAEKAWVSEEKDSIAIEPHESGNSEALETSEPVLENTSSTPMDPEEEKVACLSTFSIFQEFFRTYDTESKLILMDEILVVGEEKELQFLTSLPEDEDPRVLRKAVKIAEALRVALEAKKASALTEQDRDAAVDKLEVSQEDGDVALPEEKVKSLKPLEMAFIDETEMAQMDLFEVEFELVADPDELNDSKEEISAQNTGGETPHSLLDSFLSLPAKIIDRFNG